MATFNSADSPLDSVDQGESIRPPNILRNSPPTSLEAPISPPPSRPVKRQKTKEDGQSSPPNLAAIEAREAQIDDHLAVFSAQLARCIRNRDVGQRGLLSIDEFRDLYLRNQHRHGRHFVVSQHDHPVAGKFIISLGICGL